MQRRWRSFSVNKRGVRNGAVEWAGWRQGWTPAPGSNQTNSRMDCSFKEESTLSWIYCDISILFANLSGKIGELWLKNGWRHARLPGWLQTRQSTHHVRHTIDRTSGIVEFSNASKLSWNCSEVRQVGIVEIVNWVLGLYKINIIHLFSKFRLKKSSKTRTSLTEVKPKEIKTLEMIAVLF